MDMALDVLEKFAQESGNEELVKAVENVKATYNSNIERLGSLEKDLQGAIKKRDNTKNIVKNKLGVEDVSEETLESFLANIRENADGTIKAENQKLSQIVEELKQGKDSIESKYKQELDSYKLDRALADIGGREDANGANAYSILLSEIAKSSAFDENGNVFFKATDGTTLRNNDGTPMSLKDRYNSIRESEEFGFLFKTKRTKSGSGMNPANGKATAQSGLTRSSMSHSEKAVYIKQHGQEAYLKLPK